MIVCIGWGSLIWDPRGLPLAGPCWCSDGPELPVELARQALNDRITLVVVEGGAHSQALWAPLAVGSLAEARRALAAREGCEERWIGAWPTAAPDRRSSHWTPGPEPPGFATVAEWARGRPIDGAVWTGLPFGLRDSPGRCPDAREVIRFLRALSGECRERAEEYVRNAPPQVRTPYREAIEEALGWHPR